MRITCPSCLAEYDVPGPLAPGRVVRCARCGGQWAPVAALPLPPVIEAMVEPVATPVMPRPTLAPAAPAPLVAPRAVRAPRRAALLLAWVGSVIVLVALVAAFFVWREPIMRAWPPSVRVYGALGLIALP